MIAFIQPPTQPPSPMAPPPAAAVVAEEEHQAIGADVVVASLFLILILIGSNAAERRHLPASGFTILAGFIGGLAFLLGGAVDSLRMPSAGLFNTEYFSYLLLPPIIYEAGFSMAKGSFFSAMPTIVLLATAGTLATALAIGVATYAADRAGWFADGESGQGPLGASPLLDAFLFGACLSATDAVATLALLGAPPAGGPPLAHVLVFGESLLNDAVAIVLTRVLGQLGAAAFDEPYAAAARAAGLFAAVTVGSVGVGLAVSALSALLLRAAAARAQPPLELALTVLVGYTAYCAAEALGCSGILALFVTGACVGHYHTRALSAEAARATHVVLRCLAQLAECAVSAMVGLALATICAFAVAAHAPARAALHALLDDEDLMERWVRVSLRKRGTWRFIGFGVVVVPLVRLLVIPPLCALANAAWQRPRISWRDGAVLLCAGLRGAVAFALAVEVEDTAQFAAAVPATAAVVLSTLFLNGTLTRRVLTASGLGGASDAAVACVAPPAEAPADPPSRGAWLGGAAERWARFDDDVVGPLLVGRDRWRARPLHDEATEAFDGEPTRPAVVEMTRRRDAAARCARDGGMDLSLSPCVSGRV